MADGLKTFTNTTTNPIELVSLLEQRVLKLEEQLSETRFTSVDRYIRPQVIAKNGTFIVEEKDSTPAVATSTTGELVVVSGKLYIFNGSSWVVVGTQT